LNDVNADIKHLISNKRTHGLHKSHNCTMAKNGEYFHSRKLNE